MITKEQLVLEIENLEKEQGKVESNDLAIRKEMKRLKAQRKQNDLNATAISGAMQLAQNMLQRIKEQDEARQPDAASTPVVVNDPQ